MNRERAITSWTTGRVHRSQEHFRLHYGSAKDELRDWIYVARVGPPVAGIVKVQFVVDADDPRSATAVSAAAREIDFYLLEIGGPEAWKYAKYHCGTFSNAFSTIHWSYRNPEPKHPEPKHPEPLIRQPELFGGRGFQATLPFPEPGSKQ